ncbi:type II toxin-antitoxin system CcdA family antitoxin [Cedecea sp.]|jgi:antitoxin CcdA|uniref:type II toxin-antitoxin system CcdA family antitoxin n=1 Tax=Cedecea sp. TaxID=1970739 RepID=UPI002F4198AD
MSDIDKASPSVDSEPLASQDEEFALINAKIQLENIQALEYLNQLTEENGMLSDSYRTF